MEIKLQGTYFCVTGNFKGTNRESLLAQIRKAGGKTHKSLSLKTEVLVCGDGYMPKKQTAIERGIPVIDEAQLKQLLGGGVVEIETVDDVVPDQDMEDLIGAVRAALAHEDREETWQSLVALLDDCAVEQVESLVDYIEGHIQGWTEEEQLVCTAPLHWLTAMSKEQDFPGYRLLRSLNFNDVDFNGTQVSKCLKRPDLTQIKYLNLAVAKKLSATACKTLVKEPQFETVTHLGLGFFDQKIVDALGAGGEETSLKHLNALTIYPNCYWRIPEALYGELAGLDIMQSVETVVIGCRNSIGSSCREPIQQLCSQLPALERIELERFKEKWADSYVPDQRLRAMCVLTGTPW